MAYVDLIHTKNEPIGLLPIESENGDAGYVDVPTQDLRALRRAVLRLDQFLGDTKRNTTPA